MIQATSGKYQGTQYEWFGPADPAAPTLVLVHGLGLNRQLWKHQIEHLTQNYSVLTYDLLGHGGSAPHPTQPVLGSFSEQLQGLLQHLGIGKVCLIGFSLGGMIVRRYAMDYPEVVSGLVIMNSSHQRSDADQRAIEGRVAQVRESGPASTVEPALVRWFTDEFRQTRPDVMEQVRQWVMANDPDIYPQSYHVLAHGVAELIAPNPPIECPTLVMTAADDSGSPAAMAYALASEIKHAQTTIIEGLRHMALFESPEQVNLHLSTFLDTVLLDTNHE